MSIFILGHSHTFNENMYQMQMNEMWGQINSQSVLFISWIIEIILIKNSLKMHNGSIESVNYRKMYVIINNNYGDTNYMTLLE